MKKRIIKLSIILIIFTSCLNEKKQVNEIKNNQKLSLITEVQKQTDETESPALKLNDSMLYVNDYIQNIRELIKMELITEEQFKTIPDYENNLIEEFDDKFISKGYESYYLQLKDGDSKEFNPEDDLYYHLRYYGHVDKMELVFLYVSDDDNEAPYRLYSSVSGEKLYHLREYPSFSPKGRHIVYVDGTIMGNGDLMILKMDEKDNLQQIINNPFTNWGKAAESESEYKIKWINDNVFVFKIILYREDIQNEENKYLKIEIL